MKLLTTVLFCALLGLSSKTNDMIDILKAHLQNKESEKAISFITQNPEVLNLEDENGSSGLMIIAYSGLEKVLGQAVELKKTFSFHESIVVGKMEAVKSYLSQSNTDVVNTHSNDGFTPLSLAAFFNQTAIAKILLENGADPNRAAKNPSKVNALHSAVAKENYELCELLLAKGADVNAAQMQNVTALHSAVHRGNLELTKLFVENGASIDSKMDNGDTATIIAEREGHQKIAEYLTNKQD